jgi:hypothetical protein
MKFPTRTVNLLLVWILFSLLAIAYIGQRPFLGLAIAIVGGVVLGILSFLYYQQDVPEGEVHNMLSEEKSDVSNSDASPKGCGDL